MTETKDLLVEIGTEELPPKTLIPLSEAFGRELAARLEAHNLSYGDVNVYATPRRLAVLVGDVAASQADREIERRGPAIAAAFDADSAPTAAAHGFARSCGVEMDRLERSKTDKGEWLVFRTTEVGEATASLVAAMVEEALPHLPIPRRMRWGAGDAQFVRPVHWVVMMFGEEVVDGEIFGVTAGRVTHGHRFHHPGGIALDEPESYAMALYGGGYVVAEFAARRDMVRQQVTEAATACGGHALMDDVLLDEVTALVEWPVAIAGKFDPEFLELPDAVLKATMTGHQRYFPILDANDQLLAHFVTVSNIDSRNPNAVREGNERVLRPRLKDASFFLKTDMERSLEERLEELKKVVFQEKLGSMYDKSQRIHRLAGHVAIALGASPDDVKLARRAGLLCKCDLTTQMVGEFPELQGEIGAVYAESTGEPAEVCQALSEAYLPRFAGDAIPTSTIGRALAIADKLDSLTGIFMIGEVPTGDKDPFGLRRAALGALRIIVEGELSVDLRKLIRSAVDIYPDALKSDHIIDSVNEFVTDRLRAYFVDKGVAVDVFQAVQARGPSRPYDFARRVHAVQEFRRLPEAASLAAANKRIHNILKQADGVSDRVDDTLFVEDAEWNLAAKIVGLSPRVKELLRGGDYTGAMTSLAGLRDNVDDFFDNVKVMDDNERVKNNRLALLYSISSLFMETADISRLQD